MTFAEYLQRHFTARPWARRALASRFGVAESTVSRWATEASIPHPKIQAHVLDMLERWSHIDVHA